MAKPEEQHDQPNGHLKGEAGSEEAAAGAAQEPGKGAFPAPPAPQAAPSGSEEHECRICYNLFDLERHAPKLLECLHTFCLECLRELHLRNAHSPRSRGGGEAEQGAACVVTCPVCRHPTALPEGHARNLPVNTKLVEAILLQLRGWAPLLRELGSQRLLLQPPPPSPARPARSRSRSPSGHSSSGAATPSATATLRSLEAGPSSAEPGGDHCLATCRRKAGCLCFVFLVLALALLGFAWMEWLTGSIFLGVALLLLFASTMPFMYSFRFRSGPRTIFLPRAEASASSEVASCRNTPASRTSADGRSRW